MFDWDDFLSLATDLANRRGDEAALRTAVSRAYYATFHAAREYLVRAGIAVNTGGGAHRQVRQVLFGGNVKLCLRFRRLHDWRKEADYDELCSFALDATAQDAIIVARTTIDRIRSLV